MEYGKSTLFRCNYKSPQVVGKYARIGMAVDRVTHLRPPIAVFVIVLNNARRSNTIIRIVNRGILSWTGALFDGEQDAALNAAFLHAINMVNDDRSVLIRSRLTGVVDDTVKHTNSFMASKKCKDQGRVINL